MPIHKAVLLCAGHGTRLRPLTYSRPKHLLPVAGRPVLDWVLRDLAGCGIREACFVVGPSTERDIREYVCDGSRWGLTPAFALQQTPLGLAHATATASGFVGDDPFVLYLADNMVEDHLGELLGDLPDGAVASVLTKKVPNPCAFGVIEANGERVAKVVEKPLRPASDLAIVGIYTFTARIFEAIAAIEPSARGELEITDAIQYMVDHFGPVSVRLVTGFWHDIGRPSSVLDANRALLDRQLPSFLGEIGDDSEVCGPCVIEPGAEVLGSHIQGPAFIGARAQVVDSVIGPHVSIGPGSRVEGTRMTNSVVLENTMIRGFSAGLRDSIIAAHCELRSVEPLAASGIVLGDYSVITLG